jgi:hypothetical protein
VLDKFGDSFLVPLLGLLHHSVDCVIVPAGPEVAVHHSVYVGIVPAGPDVVHHYDCGGVLPAGPEVVHHCMSPFC